MKRLTVWLPVVALFLVAGNCWAGDNNNNNNNGGQGAVAAPEIHPAGAVAVATLLTGALALVSARRRTE